jgi:hypothetical protein
MLRALFTRLSWPLLGGAAALLVTTTTALAGSGVGATFDLGVTNTVDAQTVLTGNPGGNPLLRLTGTGTAATIRVDAGTGVAINGISNSGTGQSGQSTSGTGVQGLHSSTTGVNAGVEGRTASTSAGAIGVLGKTTAAAPGSDSAGVRGTNAAADGYGVFGENTGTGTNSVGVFGKSDGGRAGILGQGAQAGGSFVSPRTAVYGCATPTGGTPCPAQPFANGDDAVGGQFRTMAPDGIGVLACTGGDGFCSGVFGSPVAGEFFTSGDGATGLLVEALDAGQGKIGVQAFASGSAGVGVSGEADAANAVGVLGRSTLGLAGRFEGNVHVTGKLTRAYTAGVANQATPIAYGVVNLFGNLVSGTPNVTASFDSANKRYLITIAGENYSNAGYTTVVTPSGSSTVPLLPTTSAVSNQLLVRVWNLAGNPVQSAFSFVTYKP